MTRGAEIGCENVRFSYGDTEMSFDVLVGRSEVVALMGPSGSGKSTLLNLIAGFETPAAGRITIGGEDMAGRPPAARPVSMVFQENNLFGHLDVSANVGLGISSSLRIDSRGRTRIADALAMTGLAGKGGRRPAELSGGERQRVALARALLRDRPVLLLDEPFASLGPALRAEMLKLVRRLHEQAGMTVLMATHQPSDATEIAGRLVFLENGAVVADGPAGELLSEEGPPPVRRYLGSRTP